MARGACRELETGPERATRRNRGDIVQGPRRMLPIPLISMKDHAERFGPRLFLRFNTKT